ncbi:MAG: FeoA family protein [Anaerovorax sp.]|nr:FeoA family protein [Anaerovorax sp.]
MMPLTFTKVGETKYIERINGKDETKRFLNNLGFIEGSEVSIVSEIAGNLIVMIKDTRVAISREMANRIVV